MNSIGEQTFAFLAKLAEGPDKAWFDANRDLYEAHLLEPMRALVKAIAVPLSERIPDLETRPLVNKTLTRINRDMRFARPGQSPYKDHMLALFYRQGHKKDDPQLFVGLQPTESWIGLYLGPGLIADGSPIATAVAQRPEVLVELGHSAGVGDGLMLASCKRYGDIEQTFNGSSADHYLAGPHLCILARRLVAEIVEDPDRFVANAVEILTRLVPLWAAYSEGL